MFRFAVCLQDTTIVAIIRTSFFIVNQTFNELEFPFIISQINTGAPMNEVTIPNGISAGEIIVLAIVSDISMKLAPKRTEQGTEYL